MTAISVVNSENISGLIQRTLNHVDQRLVDHGIRVGCLVYQMIEQDGSFTDKEKQDITFLALLHDVGAYKTEEINEMTKFEAENILEHSIYGYLFLKYFSPLKDWAEAILFHHVPAEELDGVEERIAQVAQIINLADRVDMFWMHHPDKHALMEYINRKIGMRYTQQVKELFFKVCREAGEMDQELLLQELLGKAVLSAQECEMYLKMLIFTIDFRSQHTVTHTITTTSIGKSLARLLQMSEEQIYNVYYGALLHDLGKIGIPVEILEFPGKLSPQAMKVMRTHVNLTEEILGGTIEHTVTNIAIRHHEKLDGTGYPQGLKAEEMTMEEQVVAVADIVSALLGTRSYKDAYSKERVLKILREQAEGGKLNREIICVLEKDFDEIQKEVNENCSPILETYAGLKNEYDTLLYRYRV